jgi:hypothetical protein
MGVWCDLCGDITVAYVPIEVRFVDGSSLTINLCLDCWKRVKRSRKYLVAQLLKYLTEE